MNQAVRLRVNNEIPAYRTGLVSALDVGTSKIVCVIGQAEAGSLKILGSALRESAGLKAGTVTSLELAEESIRDYPAVRTVGRFGESQCARQRHDERRTAGRDRWRWNELQRSGQYVEQAQGNRGPDHPRLGQRVVG